MAQFGANIEGVESLSESQVAAAEMVQRICDGDTQAEAELVVLYYKPVLLMLKSRCRDSALAEDICQEVFATVVQKLRQQPIEQPHQLASYIRNMAHNMFIGDYRRKKRQNTHADLDAIKLQVCDQASAENEIHEQQLLDLVMVLLEELSQSRDRQILRLHYLTGLNKTVICERLKIPEEGYYRVIGRARQRLRELAEEKNILG